MTLDEQLKAWRDATEGLTPTPERLAALQGVIDAPTPPGGAGGGLAAGTTTAVKVLLVTVAVGVIGWAVTQYVPWRWEGHSAATRVVADGGEAACPPMQGGALAQWRGGIGGMLGDVERRDEEKEYERQLRARPLTCEAQRFPLQQLMILEYGNERALARLRARHLLLCGPGVEQTWWFSAFRGPWFGQMSGERPECDLSDWCHEPKCDAPTESCAQAYAARPAGSCNARQGKLLLAAHDCRRLLRGELALDVARARLQRAGAESRAEFGETTAAGMTWCLSAEALKEAESLRSNNAVKEESR